MKNKLVSFVLLMCSLPMVSQVGIGTVDPSATLDIRASNHSIASPGAPGVYAQGDGVLLPRVSAIPAIAGTDEGEMVYVDGAGLYYWKGPTAADWLPVDAGGATSSGATSSARTGWATYDASDLMQGTTYTVGSERYVISESPITQTIKLPDPALNTYQTIDVLNVHLSGAPLLTNHTYTCVGCGTGGKKVFWSARPDHAYNLANGDFSHENYIGLVFYSDGTIWHMVLRNQ